MSVFISGPAWMTDFKHNVDKLVLLSISDQAKDDGTCYRDSTKIMHLMTRTGYEYDACSKARKRLEDYGVLVVVKEEAGQAKQYRIDVSKLGYRDENGREHRKYHEPKEEAQVQTGGGSFSSGLPLEADPPSAKTGGPPSDISGPPPPLETDPHKYKERTSLNEGNVSAGARPPTLSAPPWEEWVARQFACWKAKGVGGCGPDEATIAAYAEEVGKAIGDKPVDREWLAGEAWSIARKGARGWVPAADRLAEALDVVVDARLRDLATAEARRKSDEERDAAAIKRYGTAEPTMEQIRAGLKVPIRDEVRT